MSKNHQSRRLGTPPSAPLEPDDAPASDDQSDPINIRQRHTFNVKPVNEDGSIIVCRDGTGTRYVTDIRFDASGGLPFSWHQEDAMMVTRPGIVDDLARAMRRAWPTMQFSSQAIRRRVVR